VGEKSTVHIEEGSFYHRLYRPAKKVICKELTAHSACVLGCRNNYITGWRWTKARFAFIQHLREILIEELDVSQKI
jgi:hypothetical protein